MKELLTFLLISSMFSSFSQVPENDGAKLRAKNGIVQCQTYENDVNTNMKTYNPNGTILTNTDLDAKEAVVEQSIYFYDEKNIISNVIVEDGKKKKTAEEVYIARGKDFVDVLTLKADGSVASQKAFQYDEKGNCVMVFKQVLKESLLYPAIENIYGKDGKIERSSHFNYLKEELVYEGSLLYHYDSSGNLVGIIADFMGNEEEFIVKTLYNKDNQLVKAEYPFGIKVGDNGEIEQLKEPIIIEYTYNKMGMVENVSHTNMAGESVMKIRYDYVSGTESASE